MSEIPSVNWTEVAKDGHPKEKMDCLLAWDDGEVTSGWYIGNETFQHANGENDYHNEPKVTHWSPSPLHPSYKQPLTRQEIIMQGKGINFVMVAMSLADDNISLVIQHMIGFTHMPTIDKIKEVTDEMFADEKTELSGFTPANIRIIVMCVMDVDDDGVLSTLEMADTLRDPDDIIPPTELVIPEADNCPAPSNSQREVPEE